MIFRLETFATLLVLAGAAHGKDSTPAEACHDYSDVLADLDLTQCSDRVLFPLIKQAFNEKQKNPDTKVKCKGGLSRELAALTGLPLGTSQQTSRQALRDLCEDALQDAVDAAKDVSGTWDLLTDSPSGIDLEEFFEGYGFLNDETGNFQQEDSDFYKKGGYNRFNYIGDDPRLNDHYPTTEASYHAGEAIYKFYNSEAVDAFLDAPTIDFEGGCPETNAAVCCWHRDRQYFDQNGNCNFADCANQNPADNTDLCWMETEDGPFPYPEDATEGDLHCHGFAFNADNYDVNNLARWNNLFYVSMYDHLYSRGYANSITDDPLIVGEQAMCGCVEDMQSVVARADCTEAVGTTNYTTSVSENGLLVVEHIPGTFSLKFRACEGFDYDANITPKQFDDDYDFNADAAGLQASNNDLSAFMFRQYLEGEISEDNVLEYEKVIIGYRNPKVNDSDKNRNEVCAAKFQERYPGEKYEQRETEDETSEA